MNSVVIQDGGNRSLSMGTATFDVLYVENYCWHLECGVTLTVETGTFPKLEP